MQRIISRHGSKTIPVKPLLDRLRSAIVKVDPNTGVKLAADADELAAQARLNVLAKTLETEAAATGGEISIRRFSEVLSKNITKPVVKAKKQFTPSLQESAYIRGLKEVKKETLQEVANSLGSDTSRFLRAKAASRAERTAWENFSKKLFWRDNAGNLNPKESAIPTLRSMFVAAEKGDDTVLNLFQSFDDMSGGGVVPWLKELSMKNELSGHDKVQLAMVDGAVRTAVGLRSGAAELVRGGARGLGKSLLIGQRPAGAGIGIMTQEMVEPEEKENE